MASRVEQEVRRIIEEHLGVEPARVTPEARFDDDLGADSLDTIELVMAAEELFGIEITDDQAEGIETVADAVALIERKVVAP